MTLTWWCLWAWKGLSPYVESLQRNADREISRFWNLKSIAIFCLTAFLLYRTSCRSLSPLVWLLSWELARWKTYRKLNRNNHIDDFWSVCIWRQCHLLLIFVPMSFCQKWLVVLFIKKGLPPWGDFKHRGRKKPEYPDKPLMPSPVNRCPIHTSVSRDEISTQSLFLHC